jgi:hypothetical protein
VVEYRWVFGHVGFFLVVRHLTPLGAGLYSIGIPKDNIVQYETEVKNGRLLLVAHGTADEVQHARDLLHQAGVETTAVHGELAAVAV